MKDSRSRFIDLRGLRYHVREWGHHGAPKLVMLHGWMDVSASFQFVVDALRDDWFVLAPDWRGFGRTSWPAADCYWFPDYLADLDMLLDALSPHEPVVLLGHSMGGNVAMMYGGIRPQRLRALINLEGFGLRDQPPERAPERYAAWIDELKAGASLRDYDTLDGVVERLRKTNPRLPLARAQFLAQHWAEPTDNGRFRVAGDPAHKIVNPVLYRWPEVAECWRRIACPVLWMEATDTDAHKWAGDPALLAQRRALVGDLTFREVPDAGHMLHHDQPEVVAREIEAFLR